MVINKGIFRGFTKELLRYAAVILLIIIGMGFVVGSSVGNGSIIETVRKNQVDSNLESGSFSLYAPMTSELKEKLNDKYNLKIEKQWYTDASVGKNDILRIFQIRSSIDLIHIVKGRLPDSKNEILVEKNYAKKNHLDLGDIIKINGETYKIVGTGTTPDYCYVKQNITDFNSNPSRFGTAFTVKAGFKKISGQAKQDNKLIYQYAFTNSGNEKNSRIIKTISGQAVLTAFTDADNNSRITAYEDDCGVMYRGTIVFGVIYFILIGYILSVFTINKIEAEKKQIGTLTSLGYRKREILVHYLILPVIIGMIASVIGILIGNYYMAGLLASDSIELYSFPAVTYSCPAALVIYAVLMPLLIIIITNGIAVSRKLNMRPLEMLHSIPQGGGKYKAGKELHGSMLGIIRKRQRSSEVRGSIVLVTGIIISTLLMIVGFSVNGSMDQYINKIDRVTNYNYVYYMNSDEADVSDGAESVLTRNVNYVQKNGNKMDVSLMGLADKSKYYHSHIKTGENKIVVSSAASEKFNISKGDMVTLNDPLKSKNYTFTVQKIVNDEKGPYFFMDKQSMKDLLDLNMDYNVIFSSNKLSFDDGQMASYETKGDILNSAKQMKENLSMMSSISQFCGLVVFLIVVYLLISMMINRSAYDISMMKIMGYRTRELIRTYIGSAYVTVFWSCIISIPIGVFVTKLIFPYFLSDTSANINAHMNPSDYIMLLIYMLACCVIILLLLTGKINKASMASVLKDEEQ